MTTSSPSPPLAKKNLQEIVDFLGKDIRLEGNPNWQVGGVASLVAAGPQDLAFCASEEFEKQLATSQAGCLILPEKLPAPQASTNCIRCAHPKAAFVKVLTWLYRPKRPVAGIHPTAMIDQSAQINPSASIMAGVFIAAGSKIGPSCVLYPGVVVMEDCQLGRGCVLHPQVVLREQTILGNDVHLHAGTVIGGDGFGYMREPEGHLKLPQVGHVVLEDGVEIGALSNVDRATMGCTKIGAGSKLDSLVHVGHNVELGKRVLLVATASVGGSSKLADDVTVGGNAAIIQHSKVGAGSIVRPFAMTTKDIPAQSDFYGIPARPFKEEMRRQAHIGQLEKLQQRVRHLEKTVAKLCQTLPAAQEPTQETQQKTQQETQQKTTQETQQETKRKPKTTS